MNYKRLGGLAVLFTFLSFPASAAVVSFLVVETGLREDASDTQYASLWEGGLMDVFFDAGHIVTNGPITRMETKPVDLTGEVKDEFEEAVMGGAEFFILGFIEYTIRGGSSVPAGIDVRIYARSGNLIHRQEFPAGTGRDLSEEFRIAQNAGRIMISHIQGR